MSLAFVTPSASQEGIRPGDQRIEAPPLQTPAAPPTLTLPRPPPQSAEEGRRLSGGLRARVERIVVEGSSVFSPEELAALVAPFEGRLLGSEELYRARDAITQLYQENGYITSGAILPDQDVEEGVVVLEVVEGRLADIDVRGTRRFRASFFRDRLAWAGRAPVNLWRIERALQLIQQDPLIERVSARLLPGDVRGESRLELTVDEALPLDLDIGASNYHPVSVGEFAGEFHASAANLVGFADRISADFSLAQGLYDIETSYSVPINRFDTLVGAFFRNSEGKVVLDDFNLLDIESQSRSFGFVVEQPFFRDFGRELRLGLIGELRTSKTKLTGDEFCTIAGRPIAGPGGSEPVADAPDCHARVAALRFFQQLKFSGARSAIALRSMITVGLDVLGATHNSNLIADGRYIAWLGQLQYIYRLPPALLDSYLVTRVDVQLASDPLLSIEKFAIGGARTVRGYRENQLVRDNGVAASVEVRIPILRDLRGPLRLSLFPFVDFGHAWDEAGPGQLGTDTIAAVGAGLGFDFFADLRGETREAIRGELQYGRRLTSAPGENGNGLQQYGVYFRITVDTLTFWR